MGFWRVLGFEMGWFLLAGVLAIVQIIVRIVRDCTVSKGGCGMRFGGLVNYSFAEGDRGFFVRSKVFAFDEQC